MSLYNNYVMFYILTFPLVLVGPMKSISPTLPAAQWLLSFLLWPRSRVSSTHEQPSRTLKAEMYTSALCAIILKLTSSRFYIFTIG